jgi:hypothetical protein
MIGEEGKNLNHQLTVEYNLDIDHHHDQIQAHPVECEKVMRRMKGEWGWWLFALHDDEHECDDESQEQFLLVELKRS